MMMMMMMKLWCDVAMILYDDGGVCTVLRPAHLCGSRRSLSIVEWTLLGISQNFPGFGDLPHLRWKTLIQKKENDGFLDIWHEKKNGWSVGVTFRHKTKRFFHHSLSKINSQPVEIGVWPGVAPLQSCLAATYLDAPRATSQCATKSKCGEIVVSSTPKPLIWSLYEYSIYLGWWICRKGNHACLQERTDSSWKSSKSTQLLSTFVSFVPTPCEPTDERPLSTEQWPCALWTWKLCQLPKSDSQAKMSSETIADSWDTVGDPLELLPLKNPTI